MLYNIRTSEANKQVVQELSRKLNLPFENIISRIALAYSISRKVKLNPETDMQDSRGKEYKEDILFGPKRDFYIALICQHYGLHRSDKEIVKYLKMHIDHGLGSIWKLFQDNPNYAGMDFLLEQVEKGIEYLADTEVPDGAIIWDDAVRALRVKSKEACHLPLKIKVGTTLDGKQVDFEINNTNIHNNAHVAVAGNPGTGKTYFANRFLEQMVSESKGKVNFIFLDFKGITGEDEQRNRAFFDKTQTSLIKAPDKPFPINPLSFIDSVNEKNRVMGINKLVDIMTGFSNIGKIQQQLLKEATKQAFSEQKAGEYPSFREIYEIVKEKEGEKMSTLQEMLESLSELELFQKEVDKQNEFINKNHYLSLSGELPKTIRFTSVFLIINYLYNTFMNMDDGGIENGYQGMRYVLLIDEAHTIFKEKKAQDILERILREIRSKGVSVVLLSQGIAEFNQQSFDFSSMCETAFLFDIKEKANLKLIQKFMGVGDKDLPKLKTSMEKIQKYQMVTNMKEVKPPELLRATNV